MADRYTRAQRQTYMNSYYLARLMKAINLLGGKCIKCGTTKYLEFDHIEPRTDQDMPVTKRLMHGWKLVLAELEKCQLLCYPCHLEKTAQDFRTGKLAYRKHGRVA